MSRGPSAYAVPALLTAALASVCLGGGASAQDAATRTLATFLRSGTFLSASGASIVRTLPSVAIGPALDPASFVTQEYRANAGLGAIRAADAYARGYTGQGVLVAVVDSGLAPAHPEFTGRVSALSRNFGSDLPATDVTDTNSHGSHVSGIIAANRQGIGMHGVAFNAQILALRAVNVPNGDTARSIEYAAANGAKVLNGSYGPGYPSPLLPDGSSNADYVRYPYQVLRAEDVNAEATAMRKAAKADVVMVFSAGNEREIQPDIGKNAIGSGLIPAIRTANAGSGVYNFIQGTGENATLAPHPAVDYADLQPYVITVVATDSANKIAPFSNYCGIAAAWCIAAPGTDIISTVPYSVSPLGYGVSSGTSMAAPFVAGTAALVREAFPFLTAPQVVETLLTTATDLGDRTIYGWGLLNAGKAVMGPGQFLTSWDVDTKGYSGTFSNDIAGPGGLTKRGSGQLQLIGNHTYAGATSVLGGTLAINGSVASAVSVGLDGTLRGNALLLAGLDSAGTVRPGNSAGQMLVGGNVAFSASNRFVLDIDGAGTGFGAGSYSRLASLGSVTVGGSLVPVLRGITGDASNSFTPVLGQRFMVLGGEGGIGGSFGGLVQPMAGLSSGQRFDALYGAKTLDLVVTPQAFAAAGQGGNQAAIGAAIDAGRPLAGTRPDGSRKELYDALYTAAPGTLAGSLGTLTGQGWADGTIAQLTSQRLVTATLDRRMTSGGSSIGSIALQDTGTRYASLQARTSAAPSGSGQASLGDGREGRIWGEALYGFGQRDRDPTARGFGFDAAGGLFGIERTIGGQALVGVAAGYVRSNADARGGNDRLTIDSYSGTAYGRIDLGDVILRGSAGGAYTDLESRRTIQVGSLTRFARGDVGGYALAANAMAGYRLATIAGAEFTPEAGLGIDHLHRAGLAEKGAAGLGLTLADDTTTAARTLLGARLGTALTASDLIRFDLRAYWAHEFGDRAGVVQASLLGQGFTVRSASAARDGAVVGASLTGRIAPGIDLAASYDGDIREGARTHRFSLGLTGRW